MAELGINVKAISGPSSIMLALMLSGLSAQTFAFHGYLEKDKELLVKQLRLLEKQKTTHIFIEAPYRNLKLFETLLQTLSDTTELCIAASLTSKEQYVQTLPIRLWKQHPLPPIDKKPTIFLFQQ